MHNIHYYQLVREYGKYDLEYTVYEARKDAENNIQIAAIPFVLVGNHPEEIADTLALIAKDIKKHPPVDKSDCDIFHDTLWHEEDEPFYTDEVEEPEPSYVDEDIMSGLGSYNDD